MHQYLAATQTSVNPLQKVAPVRRLCRLLCSFLRFPPLKHTTINLSALRINQIHLCLGDPFIKQSMPLLDYFGLKCTQARTGSHSKPRMPITLRILAMLSFCEQWIQQTPSHDNLIPWAVACTGCFFRQDSSSDRKNMIISIYQTLQSTQTFAPNSSLSQSSRTKMTFRLDAVIYLGTTKAPVCPFHVLYEYLAVQDSTPGPLQVSLWYSANSLLSDLPCARSAAGLNAFSFNGHSF